MSKHDFNKGAYADVENLKKGKYAIAKYVRRLELLIAFGCSLTIMILFTTNFISKDIYFFSIFDFLRELKDFIFSFNGSVFASSKDFNYILFFSINIFIVIFLYVFIFDVKNKIINLIFNNTIFSFFNMFRYIPNDLNNLKLQVGFIAKLEKYFFKQTVVKNDGYERAKELKIFNDLSFIFGADVFDNVQRLFKNNNDMLDLFYIIEGYLHNSKLYDELLINERDIKEENFQYFQSYILKENQDCVRFSKNAISFFIDKEKKEFSQYINKMFNYNGVSVPQKHFILRIKDITKDKHFHRKVIEKYMSFELYEKLIKNKDIKEHKEKIEEIQYILKKFNNFINATTRKEQLDFFNDKIIFNIFYEFLLTDFSFLTFRLIMSQWLNVPAGTIVTKLKSYDTRMIVEYYKSCSLIEIVAGRNDGSNMSFNSDTYVNLFLTVFYSYLNNSKINTLEKIKYFFNTDERVKPIDENKIKDNIDSFGLLLCVKKFNDELNNKKNEDTENENQKEITNFIK